MKAKPYIDYSYRDWFIHGLTHFGQFSGRVPRKGFWGFHILAFLIYLAIAFFGALTLGGRTGTILALYQAALFLPSLALLIRRLHDTGRSGWYSLPLFILTACNLWLQTQSRIPPEISLSPVWLIACVAALCWLYLFIICGFIRGEQGSNAYGPPPYERMDEEKPDELTLSQI